MHTYLDVYCVSLLSSEHPRLCISSLFLGFCFRKLNSEAIKFTMSSPLLAIPIKITGISFVGCTSSLLEAKTTNMQHIRSDGQLRASRRGKQGISFILPLLGGDWHSRNQSDAAFTWCGSIRRERPKRSEANVELLQLAVTCCIHGWCD